MKLLRFVSEHLGTAASIIGAILTVYFAWGAKTSAERAREAAQEARNQIASVSILGELNSTLVAIEDMSRRMHTGSWEIVEERATSIRNRIAPIVKQHPDKFSSEVRTDLVQLVSQMKSFADTAEKVRFTRGKEPSKPRLLALLKDQKEVLVLAIAETKERLSQNDI